MDFVIRQATVADLEPLVSLFDSYRRFYRYPGEPERIRKFLLDRFEHNQSVIFVALDGDRMVGFTQLYPSFSSGSLARIFVLNDLFVDPGIRRRGVGRSLLQAAAHYGRRVGALRLTLATETTNMSAQSLYETLGWRRDTQFYVYNLTL
jgi:GNAT superfamily N-acetyltransferase